MSMTSAYTPKTPSVIVRFILRPDSQTKGKTFLFTIKPKG